MKNILTKSIPVWLVGLLIFQTSLVTGVIEYAYLTKQSAKNITELVKGQKDPEALVAEVQRQVLPSSGYTTKVMWGDIVKRLVQVGAIDEQKYKDAFKSKTDGIDELDLLTSSQNRPITIHENNAHFIVNTLWALGLTQKSKILDEGQMKTSGQTANMASTGGWTLGKQPAMTLYSSEELVKLTKEQQDLVQKIAENVFRPCCGNPTSFPDCNHGMAALGYIELAVAVGIPEEQIYKDLLAFNSFWFPQQYTEMAVYFAKEKGTSWDKVDAKLALSNEYSSAQGSKKVSAAVQNTPGVKTQGGGCGA